MLKRFHIHFQFSKILCREKISIALLIQLNMFKAATQKEDQKLVSRPIFVKCRSKVLQNAPREHSAILWTFTNPPLVFNTSVLSIFEWPFKTGLLYIGQGHSRRLILKIVYTHVHPSETRCRAMASVDIPQGHRERSTLDYGTLFMCAPYLLSPGANFEIFRKPAHRFR